MKNFFEELGYSILHAVSFIIIISCLSLAFGMMKLVNPIMAKKDLPLINQSLKETPPIITADNQRIKIGDTINIISYAKANDVRDGNISASIKAYGEIDSNVKGRYEVHYEVENSIGRKGYKNIYVIVD